MAICTTPTPLIINSTSYNFILADASSFPNCTSNVLLTQTEFLELQNSATNNILQLSAADGAQIAGAILALWAMGYAFRVLIQFLKSQ